ncbi:MAG: CehA/McbA family metallohydrolase [Chloroflexi bacterium]|nr:CehA/McbA family metallohydrolase [Chloroflexota bacterium]
MTSSNPTYHFQGRFTPDDKAQGDYRYLFFDVPPGVHRIDVRYEYEGREGGGNTIDIGLFDSRGGNVHGFRGWSGGARDRFTVAERDATPGYLPGPLPAGRWSVMLGLYRIQEAGCRWQVDVWLWDDPGLGQGYPTLSLPEVAGLERGHVVRPAMGGEDSPRWFRGDFQSHTYHSDASGSPGGLAAAARARGLDFVAVTDHNTVSQVPHLRTLSGDDLLLIPSVEVTTYYGHANVWGIDRWLDFRCRSRDDVARVIEEAHRRGRLFSVNHPKEGGPPWEYGTDLPFDCVEVWQAPWFVRNWESRRFWMRLLEQGRRVVAVGGSDRHQPPFRGVLGFYEVGTPTTWVYAEALAQETILAGVRAGHVFISESPAGPRIELTAEAGGHTVMMGDELPCRGASEALVHARVLGASGKVLWLLTRSGLAEAVPITSDGFEYAARVPVDAGFVRAEIVYPESEWGDLPGGEPRIAALGNPIYLRSQ